jgi:hypothetical protein
VIDFVNFKIKSAQYFRVAHMNKVYVYKYLYLYYI